MTKLTDENRKLFVFRPYQESDKNFIYVTWMTGLYFGNDTWRLMKRYTFYCNYQKVLDSLIPRCTITVCALADDPDTAIGYCVTRGTALDWVFIKEAWRRHGIARALIPEGIQTVSHMTKMVRGIKPKEWEFNPFL